MTIPFTSVQGLAGGMELGIVQTGEFELKHRTGSLNLGAPIAEANRKLLGWSWEGNYTDKVDKLHVKSVPFVSSNAPCAAFSTLSVGSYRGVDAPILSCTDEVYTYASLMATPPQIIAIESVQQAYSTGRAYYQRKRDELEDKTGQKYDLVWMMQSNAAVGGASLRKRVFVIYTRIPFGVEYAQPYRVARFGDAVRDLEGLASTSRTQPYVRPGTWWSSIRRSPDGVDGHWVPKISEQYKQLMDTAAAMGEPWTPGEQLGDVLRRVHESGRELPYEWQRRVDKMIAKNWNLGINQTGMWNPNKMGHVVTGAGPLMSTHYKEHRLLTYRETFRLQGFPDDWRLWPVRDYKKLGACPGKGVPVDAGRYLGKWVADSINGCHGTVQGKTIGERERFIDITHSYKHTLSSDAPWRYPANTVHSQRSLEVDKTSELAA